MGQTVVQWARSMAVVCLHIACIAGNTSLLRSTCLLLLMQRRPCRIMGGFIHRSCPACAFLLARAAWGGAGAKHGAAR